MDKLVGTLTLVLLFFIIRDFKLTKRPEQHTAE